MLNTDTTLKVNSRSHKYIDIFSSDKVSVEKDSVSMQDVSFDPDKMMCCSIENGHTLVHGVGGRGYGLGATPVSSGCYQWKVSIIWASPRVYL